MSKIFSLDNPVVVVLTKIFDVMYLSLLYLIFCLPIITIGAATTSLYYVSAKVIRRSQSYVWREFWKSFKLNFKQSTIYWVVILVIYLLLGWNINYLGLNNPETANYGSTLSAVYLTMIIILVAVSINIFPIISRFDNKLMTSVKFALYCCFRHFLHTLAMFLMVMVGVYLVYLNWGNPMLMFTVFLPGIICWLITFPMEHVLKKYMPKAEQQLDSEGRPIKMWYDE
ncbi:MAG: YesL family protein [Eubacterium sp.]|nr:YesL family protein [Eubacterium sp.]